MLSMRQASFAVGRIKRGYVRVVGAMISSHIYAENQRHSRRGTVRISVCGRAVDHQAAMALMKRSPKITANCAFAMVHSRGGIFHSFSDRFKIR